MLEREAPTSISGGSKSLGHANYFNQKGFNSNDDALSETFIESIKSQPGFEEGGRLYYNVFMGQCSIDYEEKSRDNNTFSINRAVDGKPVLDLYGMEELHLHRLEL